MWIENRIFREDMEFIRNAPFLPWEKLEGKTVLVTGATGLIGFYVANALLCSGRNIRVLLLVRNAEQAGMQYGSQQKECADRLALVEGDMEDFPRIEMPVDYVVHGACPTASRFLSDHPVETILGAVKGMGHILDMARSKQVSGFAYLSSVEAYGQIPVHEKIKEEHAAYLDSTSPRNSYPVSKRLCETLCAAYAAEYGVPAKSLRLTQTFGPSERQGDMRLFASILDACRKKRDIVLLTEGRSAKSYLYLADAVTAILSVLLNGKAGEVYNAANENTYATVREVSELAARVLTDGACQVRIERGSEGETRAFMPELYADLDTSRLQSLGWEPSFGLEDIFLRTMEASR